MSRKEIWQLIKGRVLPARSDLLHGREERIPTDAIAALKGRGDLHRPQGFRSDGSANNPNAPRSDELEDYLRDSWYAGR